MEQVKIYQIGLGSFGRHGFDKLVEIAKEFDKIDFAGVCDVDFEKLEKAEKFADANKVEIETFQDINEMYSYTKKEEAQVMIYDASPADQHSKHVYRSMQNEFFHLSEKPPSLNRGEHIKEKRLAEKGKAMWKCDFIERESPVVKKTLEILEGEDVDSIKVFRESSAGLEKAIDPSHRLGVKGGDILDKMVHEVYVLDILEKTGHNLELELENMETSYFCPWKVGSEKFARINGGYTEELSYETATGMTTAQFSSNNTAIELNSSWLGQSEKAMIEAKKIKEETGHQVFSREYSEFGGKAYVNEECRFFVVEGSRRLAGDMLEKKLFDLETGDQIELDNYLHDQLYRVIESAVFQAAGKEEEIVSEKEIDVFMNSIFDVKEAVETDRDYYEALDKANEKLRKMIVEDGKVLEAEQAETIAG